MDCIHGTWFKHTVFIHEKIITYICSAQSENRYNSGIVLRKVGILTGTILELRKGFWLLIEQVKVSAQSGNLWDKVGIDYFI